MRLFAGLPLPESAVERLASLRLRLSAPRDGLRWSSPEQWHITLQFYGEVSEQQAACLVDALRDLKVAGAEVALSEFGTFDAKGILFVDVAASAGLSALQREVAERSRACGIVPESREFRPHVTLARSKGREGVAGLRRLCRPSLPAFGPEIRWVADEVLLYESVLRPQGSEYTVRARLPLPGRDIGPGAQA